VARIELPDGSQLPRIGVMVSGLWIDAVMAAFEALQPDQPWLQVLHVTLGITSMVIFLTLHGTGSRHS